MTMNTLVFGTDAILELDTGETCPQCGTYHGSKIKKCRYCGYKVVESQPRAYRMGINAVKKPVDEVLETVFNPFRECPKCGVVRHFKRRGGKLANRVVYRCHICKYDITPLAKTIFRQTKLPIATWRKAYFMIKANRLISDAELTKIGISYPGAWRLKKIILNNMIELHSYFGAEESYKRTISTAYAGYAQISPEPTKPNDAWVKMANESNKRLMQKYSASPSLENDGRI